MHNLLRRLGVAGVVGFCVVASTLAFSGGVLPEAPAAGASQPSSVTDSYWLVAADGGVFAFGDAGFYGSMGGSHLNAPVVGMAAAPGDQGYWLAAADGGVFNFGDAGFYGSMGNSHLNAPVVGIASTPDGKGYWLVAADGGVFNFGDAGFFGSMGASPMNAPVVGIAATTDGSGYYLAGADGGVFNFGDAVFYGSFVGYAWQGAPVPVIGLALNFGAPPVPPGYYVATTNGQEPSLPGSGSFEAIALDGPAVGFSANLLVTGTGQVAIRGTLPTQYEQGLTGVQLNAPVVGMFSFQA
ncbi:MAG TPA: hypothetical protein VHZ02_14755 [Acidimicrobiales bacterium]|nr:hypothetical protein [Acidimicrobiales bacterium]